MDLNISKERGSMTYVQKEQLVQFVEENFSSLFQTSSGDPTQVRLWNLITQILNALGPEKNVQGWKRCFTCLKSTAKTKLFKNLQLSEIENKIIKICKMDLTNRLQPVDVSAIRDNESNSHSANTSSTNTIENTARIVQNQIAPSNVNSRFPESEIYILDNSSSVMDEAQCDDVQIIPIVPQVQLCRDMGMIFSNLGGSQFIPQSQNEHDHENYGFTMLHESSNLNCESNQQSEFSSLTAQMAESIQLQHTSEQVTGTINQMKSTRQPQNKRSYSNSAQRQKLVELVKENYNALFGRVSNRLYADLLKNKIWKLITLQLNSIGPAKNEEGWKRCLSTLKDQTKKKNTAIRQGKTDVELTMLENQINNIFHTLDGSEKLHELGLNEKVNRGSVLGRVSSSNSNYLPHQQQGRVTATVTSSQMALSDLNSASQNTSRVRVTATVTSTVTSSQMALSDLNSVSQNTSNQFDSQNEVQPSVVLPELGIETTAENNMPEINESIALYSPMILSEESTSTVQHSQRERVPIITSNQNIVPPIADQLQHQEDNVNSGTEEIRPLEEERPQRRGVEINLNRYIQPHRLPDSDDYDYLNMPNHLPDSDDDDDLNMPPRGRAARGRSARGRGRRGRDPRRVRLSIPLGVMAGQSLEFQRRTNALLSEILFEIRNTANRG